MGRIVRLPILPGLLPFQRTYRQRANLRHKFRHGSVTCDAGRLFGPRERHIQQATLRSHRLSDGHLILIRHGTPMRDYIFVHRDDKDVVKLKTFDPMHRGQPHALEGTIVGFASFDLICSDTGT